MSIPIILRRDHELYNEGHIRIVSRYQRVLTKVEFDYLEKEQLFLKEQHPVIYAKCCFALHNETNVKRLKQLYYADRYLVFCYEHSFITGFCSIHFYGDNLICDYVCGTLNAQQMMLEVLDIYEAEQVRIFIPEYNRDLKTACRKTVGAFFANTVVYVKEHTHSKYDLVVKNLSHDREYTDEYKWMNKDYIEVLNRFETSYDDLEDSIEPEYVWLVFNHEVLIGMVKICIIGTIAYVSIYVKPAFRNQDYSASIYSYIPQITEQYQLEDNQKVEYIYHRCAITNIRSYRLAQSIFKTQIASDCI